MYHNRWVINNNNNNNMCEILGRMKHAIFLFENA